jgi:hypothetical protein
MKRRSNNFNLPRPGGYNDDKDWQDEAVAQGTARELWTWLIYQCLLGQCILVSLTTGKCSKKCVGG